MVYFMMKEMTTDNKSIIMQGPFDGIFGFSQGKANGGGLGRNEGYTK